MTRVDAGLDTSLSRSNRSFASTNSAGLPRCMIVRTETDAADETKMALNRARYEQRKQERLKSKGAKQLKVSFDLVEMREYPIILGYNPAVSKGPPLEIAWDHVDTIAYRFDDFEASRPIRRTYVEMNIPMEIRIQMLESLGFTTKEITQRAKEVKTLRIRRMETQQQMYRSKNHEQMEMIQRGLRNLFTGKKRKERALLEKTKQLGVLPPAGEDDSESIMNI